MGLVFCLFDKLMAKRVEVQLLFIISATICLKNDLVLTCNSLPNKPVRRLVQCMIRNEILEEDI